MLKHVPAILSPELLYAIAAMGHGDEIVLADGNFPAESHAQRCIRADGHSVPAVLEAILKFLPLDTFIESPAFVMQPVEDEPVAPPHLVRFPDHHQRRRRTSRFDREDRTLRILRPRPECVCRRRHGRNRAVR